MLNYYQILLITHFGKMKIKIKKNTNKADYINWPIWECEKSQFDWEYQDEEHCYILAGHVIIDYNQENIVIKKGDYVIFPKGLKCNWKVLEPIRKHYMFK